MTSEIVIAELQNSATDRIDVTAIVCFAEHFLSNAGTSWEESSPDLKRASRPAFVTSPRPARRQAHAGRPAFSSLDIRAGEKEVATAVQNAKATFESTLTDQQQQRLQFVRQSAQVVPIVPALQAAELLQQRRSLLSPDPPACRRAGGNQRIHRVFDERVDVLRGPQPR